MLNPTHGPLLRAAPFLTSIALSERAAFALAGRVATRLVAADARHRDVLLRLAMGTDDLRQEVLLRCWQAYGAGASRQPGVAVRHPAALLGAVTRSTLADLRDRALRRPLLEAAAVFPGLASPGPGQAEVNAVRQVLHATAAAMARLSPRRRAAVLAAVAGTAPLDPAARQALRRARHDLRQMLHPALVAGMLG